MAWPCGGESPEISDKPAHEALVSEQVFVAVQAFRAVRPTENGTRRTYRQISEAAATLLAGAQQLAYL